MFRSKSLFLSLLVALLLVMMPGITYALPTPGTVIIEVVDQNNNPISGFWFLHEGTGEGGMIVRNGTTGETFMIASDMSYFLRGQTKAGYESFAITSENPQAVVPRSYVTYRLVYYAEGYAASLTMPQQQEEASAPEAPAQEEQPSAMQEEPETELVMPEAQDQETPARRLVRSPLHVEPPQQDRLAYTGLPQGVVMPMRLAVTGPGGLLMLMIGSGVGGVWAMRRRWRI